MSPVEYAKAYLTSYQEDLLQRIADIESSRRHSDSQPCAAPRDRLQERQNDEVLDRLTETTRRELLQVNHALDRIRAGRHGICEDCHQRIDAYRLEAVPEATRCSDCIAALAAA